MFVQEDGWNGPKTLVILKLTIFVNVRFFHMLQKTSILLTELCPALHFSGLHNSFTFFLFQ